MSQPYIVERQAAVWVDKNVKPLVASLASQGHLDGVEAMGLLDGIERLLVSAKRNEALLERGWPYERILALIAFVEKHGDAIKRAAQG